MWLSKRLQFCLICLKDILPETRFYFLTKSSLYFFYVFLSTVKPSCSPIDLCPPFTLSFYLIWGQWPSCGHTQWGWIQSHGPNPFICNFSHRNVKLLGDVLIAFAFYMLAYNFLFNLLRQCSHLLCLVHVQSGAHDDDKKKKQRDNFSPFKLTKRLIARLKKCNTN